MFVNTAKAKQRTALRDGTIVGLNWGLVRIFANLSSGIVGVRKFFRCPGPHLIRFLGEDGKVREGQASGSGAYTPEYDGKVTSRALELAGFTPREIEVTQPGYEGKKEIIWELLK